MLNAFPTGVETRNYSRRFGRPRMADSGSPLQPMVGHENFILQLETLLAEIKADNLTEFEEALAQRGLSEWAINWVIEYMLYKVSQMKAEKEVTYAAET